MLWSLIFFVCALVVAFVGFAGLAGSWTWLAAALCLLFLLLFVLATVTDRRAPPA